MAEQEVEQIQKLPVSEEERQEDEQPESQLEKATEPESESEKAAETESEKPAEPESEKPAEPESEKPAEPESEKPAEPESEKPAEPESEKPAEPESEKPAEPVSEKPAEPESEKPAEPESEKPAEPESEKPAEPESEKPAEPESEKPAEPELEKPVEKEAGKQVALQQSVEEPTEPPTEKQPEESENLGSAAQKQQPKPEEEAAAAPSPAPGSLSFPFLEEESTEVALRESRTLCILLGLPGAGKTYLATAIRDRYQDLCSVISADDHGVKLESYETTSDGHTSLDAALVSCCASGTAVVVVDDTNHTNERLARLGELAEEYRYFALFLEPRTDWCRDMERLSGKTSRGLDKSQIQVLKVSLEDAYLPFYFGWFLRHTFQDELEGVAKGFLKTLDSLEAFKKHLSDFPREGEDVVKVEQYFQHTGPLHCTTKFCDYGKAAGAKEYAKSQVVQQSYGSMTELKLQALFLTPRTLGARVALTQEQLQLWPSDPKEEAGSNLPPGSRAHITLGCAQGVEPVQTGVDLLQILQLQQQGQEGEKVEDLELGPLSYYGNGIWVLSLREPIIGPALFSSFHGHKKPEEVRKKKPKCTIL
ncbi:hypothetical protein SKAU_G00288940 [Synaphobranchus kaupii]|uniref:2',3'-cyclic-nucleotide 3'-phosphodiesterase n=1 Tax=Synaphobranchus kaupii TaxID=118154 RepID=A0A9Q1ETA8_SYNKA|nr:hypothetical protein SKAU_G00288940 [Synaphobranchus kaupii]